MVNVISNNAPRDLLYWHDLTDSERAEFDWINSDNGESFFRYRGAVYALSEFVACDGDTFPGWNGIHHETHFSGVLVKWLSCDAESVICGRYFA